MGHVKFAFELYQLQALGWRYFIHEHPKEATSWKLKEVSSLRKVEGVRDVVADQCMYGLAVRARNGRNSAVKKPTRFLTNAECVVDELQRKCSGDHMHQQPVGGKAELGDAYTPELRRAICRGVAKETKMRKRKVVPIMLIQESVNMRNATLADEWREDEAQAGVRMEAWDDLTGLPLDPKRVLEARKKELS